MIINENWFIKDYADIKRKYKQSVMYYDVTKDSIVLICTRPRGDYSIEDHRYIQLPLDPSKVCIEKLGLVYDFLVAFGAKQTVELV